jgi:LmbE family N-acetylglucosaminyl deacetylase
MGIEEILRKPLVVVAHQDDESIGCGILMQRMKDVTVAYVTDGAFGWQGRFPTREDYVTTRRDEARAALMLAGVSNLQFGSVEDLQLYKNLQAAHDFITRIARTSIPIGLLTLTFEGVHPYHYFCSNLCNVIGKELERPVWEMPFYHQSGAVAEYSEFLHKPDEFVAITGSEEEAHIKSRMFSCYATQANVLKDFEPSLQIEKFRPQPLYNFYEPANPTRRDYRPVSVCTGTMVAKAMAEFLFSR